MQMIEFNIISPNEFNNFRTEFSGFRKEVYYRFDSLEQKLENKIDHEINKLSLQLTVKLGIMLAMSVGLLSTILAIKL